MPPSDRLADSMKPAMFCRKTSGTPRSVAQLDEVRALQRRRRRTGCRCRDGTRPGGPRSGPVRRPASRRRAPRTRGTGCRRRPDGSPRARRTACGSRSAPRRRDRAGPRPASRGSMRSNDGGEELAGSVEDDGPDDGERLRVVVREAVDDAGPAGAHVNCRRGPRRCNHLAVAAFTSGGPPREIVPFFLRRSTDSSDIAARRHPRRCRTPSRPPPAGCPGRRGSPG